MEKESYVYGLIDPRTFAVRYIGRTGGALAKRRGQHIAASKLRKETPLAEWLRGLVGEGLGPYIVLLATVPDAEWRREETTWIARMRAEGHDLLNGHSGGTGPSGGYRWSAEGVERMARTKVGRARGGTSRYPGVSRHKATGRWAAQFRGLYLGLYDDEDAAFETYRAAFRDCYGQDVPGWENWKPADALAEIGEPRPTLKLA